MAYATLDDLYVHGAPEQAFGQLSEDTQNAALEAASEVIDSYFRGRYSLPLSSWDSSVRQNTCRIAAYNLLSSRGYNPAAGSDANVLERYNQAIAWCEKVQKQQAHPNVTPAQADVPMTCQPVVITSSVVNVSTGGSRRTRGW